MEPPTCFDAERCAPRRPRCCSGAALSAPRTRSATSCAGSTAAGTVNGKDVAGLSAVAAMSRRTPAPRPIVALKLKIDNWRWAGVPFYLRTGKALGARRTEIAIRFKQAPLALFRDTPVERLTPNELVLHIQPDEGMTLQLRRQDAGPEGHDRRRRDEFEYKDYFKAAPSTGYETLIYDCMIGDATLFQRADEIEAGWRIVQPMLDVWAEEGQGTGAICGRLARPQRGRRAAGARRAPVARAIAEKKPA